MCAGHRQPERRIHLAVVTTLGMGSWRDRSSKPGQPSEQQAFSSLRWATSEDARHSELPHASPGDLSRKPT